MYRYKIGGYTFGADYHGIELNAVVHDDGIIIIDDEMSADYINGYHGNYYLGDGTDAINRKRSIKP